MILRPTTLFEKTEFMLFYRSFFLKIIIPDVYHTNQIKYLSDKN